MQTSSVKQKELDVACDIKCQSSKHNQFITYGYFSELCEDSALLKDGTPSEDDLEHLANNIFHCWKVLGRKLELNESVLISIDREEKRTSEKCYKMLKKWKECNGSAVDFKTLAQGLGNHLVQRKDLAYKYCYITKDSEQARRELRTCK